MPDREALRFMLIYAQREAESLHLTSVARLIAEAATEIDKGRLEIARLERTGSCGERALRPDAIAEAEVHGHFRTERLQ